MNTPDLEPYILGECILLKKCIIGICVSDRLFNHS